jgi:hypothetical protein
MHKIIKTVGRRYLGKRADKLAYQSWPWYDQKEPLTKGISWSFKALLQAF